MQKPLILVIDDEPKQTDMIAKLIEATGRYEAVKAYGAREGLNILKRNRRWFQPNRVELILLDIKMPEMDGLQFLEELRKKFRDLKPGVIMLTAYEDEEKWDRATSGFVAGYLKKPVVEKELLAAMDRFFSSDEAQAKMTLATFEKHIGKKEEFKQQREEKI